MRHSEKDYSSENKSTRSATPGGSDMPAEIALSLQQKVALEKAWGEILFNYGDDATSQLKDSIFNLIYYLALLQAEADETYNNPDLLNALYDLQLLRTFLTRYENILSNLKSN